MMKSCLIWLNLISSTFKYQDYHDECVIAAFGSIDIEPILNGTADTFFIEARKHLAGFCIAGVQAKHTLAIQKQDDKQHLTISNQNSDYIFKPCPAHYQNLDSNEHLSQEIMRVLGFNVPGCGILKFEDSSTAYFIKRYDRLGNGTKLHQEDMLAAMGIPNTNENIKYQGSYEAVAKLLKKFGSANLTAEFIKRIISAYLLGNGDFHLKNISIIYSENGIELSPVYDFVNTHMYGDTDLLCLDLLIDEPEVESFEDFYCLQKKDFVALSDRVEVPADVINEFIENNIVNNLDKIFALIQCSSLDDKQKKDYLSLVSERIGHLTI